MHKYIDIKRVEFVVTHKCTGNCKHCSIGNKLTKTGNNHIEYSKIQSMLSTLSKKFDIESVMCFGGEPLLYAEDVCSIMWEARNCNIPKRQIITNGYFSKSKTVIADVVYSLEEACLNQILLSVDAFHQESIPLEPVLSFAQQVKNGGNIEIQLHPAWLVNEQADNSYNQTTRELLSKFSELHLPLSKGNNIFPAGNAATYLSEYYEKKPINLNQKCGEAPYTTRLDAVDTISISPNGDVFVCCFIIGNVYEENIENIIARYNPYENAEMSALINGGVCELADLAKSKGSEIQTDNLYSACSVCREIVKKLYESE
jgi:MoaA/NifB/PqqE/SkfB family radical SAM enzyme